MTAKLMLALLAVFAGLVLMVWGLRALYLGFFVAGYPALPGTDSYNLRDQGAIAVLAASISWWGAAKLGLQRERDD